MSNYLQVQQVKPAPVQSLQIERLTDLMKSPSGLILLGCFAVMAIFQVLSGRNSKGKVATSYWGGSREKSLAAHKAKKQISKPTRNSVALYVGTPGDIRITLQKQWYEAGLLKTKPTFYKQFISPNSTLYVPDAQRGIAVIGAAGSGKTFSVIDPLIRSAFDQGFPMLLYDFKFPAQTKRAVAYAIKRGYTVKVFAPGFSESETCNPLDLLRDEEDAIAAGQLTQVISRNFDRGVHASSDKFFEEAGDSLVEGILLVTKAIKTLTGEDKYCDLMMARAILGGTATKFIFNPQDPESAKLFSDYLGEMEIKFSSKSRSTGKGGGSRSSNEHHQKRHLFEPAQFAKMGTGRAVIINPAYTRGTEAYVPLLQGVKVPSSDIDEMKWSESKWDFVRERLIQNNSLQISDDERSQQFLERRELAQQLFPVPESSSLASPEELSNVF
ncbi:transfer complex protein TrsK-like protein [Calothrix sp. NIES-2100]|uniref:type IV secretory system conjugative DNA transfer family protein n=1 Tax=Calothrix sp. NIES-2100 TaxID=1954172 RepID=UPI000B6014B4|nr:transfer complex protein TrsK-like protein [Calothrix sp. NIES-2100]